MKVDIVIPTYKRKEPLLRALSSIEMAKNALKQSQQTLSDHEVDVKVFVSTEEEYYDLKGYDYSPPGCVIIRFVKEYRAPTFWNDYLKTMTSDALCYLNDDIELHSDCLVEGIKAMDSLDKVVGFNQANSADPSKCASAFGLIGREFADRFPDRQVFCPDYYALYLDEELGDFAKSLGKFVYCEAAKMNHFHPAWTKEPPDETHNHNRRNKNKDMDIYKERKKRGLIWGRSFELVNNE